MSRSVMLSFFSPGVLFVCIEPKPGYIRKTFYFLNRCFRGKIRGLSRVSYRERGFYRRLCADVIRVFIFITYIIFSNSSGWVGVGINVPSRFRMAIVYPPTGSMAAGT